MLPSRITRPLIGLLCFSLAACVTTPMANYASPLDYATMKPLQMDIAEALVLNDGSTTSATKELAVRYGQTPEAALREWASKRILPSGPQGSLTIVIRDANFAVKKLALPGGVKGYFSRDQEARWDVYLNALVAVEGSASMLPQAEITVTARASHTIPEEASEQEKREIYNSIINTLMRNFDQEAERQMHSYFRAYMK